MKGRNPDDHSSSNNNWGDRGMVTRVTWVTRGDGTEGGEEGKGERGEEEEKEEKENCRGRDGWTTTKALYEVLADLKRNWVGIKAEKRDEKRNWVSMDYERSPH